MLFKLKHIVLILGSFFTLEPFLLVKTSYQTGILKITHPDGIPILEVDMQGHYLKVHKS